MLSGFLHAQISQWFIQAVTEQDFQEITGRLGVLMQSYSILSFWALSVFLSSHILHLEKSKFVENTLVNTRTNHRFGNAIYANH